MGDLRRVFQKTDEEFKKLGEENGWSLEEIRRRAEEAKTDRHKRMQSEAETVLDAAAEKDKVRAKDEES
ncbi:MAG TPA: hypothetical protein VNW29_02850 [Candidatus Sulfotelmatobacter sp.]|nr:hypothetical protein [Candidatus Sulfotelmatobacter sp.]